MARRKIDPRPVDSVWAHRRDLIGSVAIIGFFLGMLVLAILAQARIANGSAAAAGPAQAHVTAQPSAVAPSAQPTPMPTPPAAAPAAPPRQPTKPAVPVSREHTVEAGETLAELALRYQVPLEQIAADNGIADQNQLVPGQSLVLLSPPPGVQVIQPGATLSGYAEQFARSVADLMALNPQLSDPNQIVAGAGLRVTAQ